MDSPVAMVGFGERVPKGERRKEVVGGCGGEVVRWELQMDRESGWSCGWI